jgi:hypothetical protein
MSWTGAVAAIKTHLTTQGAALTNPIGIVRETEPLSIPARMIAFWYSGDRQSATGGNTLTKTNIEEQFTIRAYWPVADNSETLAAARDAEVHALLRLISAALWGDVELGGQAIGLSVEPAEVGWLDVDGANVRTLTVPVWVDLAEVDTISA